MSPLPFQLLELNVVSAQDLAPVSKNLRTYAIIWINPERKLRTRVDQLGQINPAWNDKFVFRTDEKFLNSEASSVMIEIYALGWLRDVLVGSIRVLISNLIPENVRKQKNSSRHFVALQIRRPSGRPQGILNMGVTFLDNNLKSMPLYTELSGSAVGFQDLMDVKMYREFRNDKSDTNVDLKEEKMVEEKGRAINRKTKLRRTQSDCTDVKQKGGGKEGNNESSVCNVPVYNGSVVNGSSLNGSIVNGSEVGAPCNSDVGLSPSVVAAAVARGLYPTPLVKPHNPGSSILEDWTVEDSSVEGLKSKLERWKMELPGKCDNITCSYQKIQKQKQQKRSSRRHSVDAGSGMLSCFGGAYGCEFTEQNCSKSKFGENDFVF